MRDKKYLFGDRFFTVSSEKSLSDLEITKISDVDGIVIYEFSMDIADPSSLCDAVISWEEAPRGITGFWIPCGGRNRYIPQGWYAQRQYSTLTDGAPVLSLFLDSSDNYLTFALSEAERPFEMSFWLRNDPGQDTLHLQLKPFCGEVPRTDRFSFFLRVDERKLPLADSVREVGMWWKTFYPSDERIYSDAFAGDKPLFSSWYALFQNPRQDVLEKELPFISDLGFRSMIIDDGWSYDGKGDGAYTNCGTWEMSSEKFPDMTSFVKKSHDYGIRVALWFPIPFVGKKNPDYRLFEGKMLDEKMGAGVLDPRYPEVREYIVGNYINIIKKYDLDGLKLDFLTDFNHPAPENAPGTDCSTVNEAVTKLLADIESRVRSLDPDILIEYRACYFGPSVIRHCNMLRMSDCAFDFITNRIGVVDLRMLDYPVAVHSDMLLWSADETPENIAVMLLNVLFSVPQISVLSADMTSEQRAVLKNYLTYWTAHGDLLLHGKISVKDPQANYSSVSASDGELTAAVQYLASVFQYAGGKTDLFNASSTDSLIVDAASSGTAVCYDIFGKRTAELQFCPGVIKLPVPRGGRAELR